jgi:quinol monooxygenase YgiN
MSSLEVSARMKVREGGLEGFKRQAAECIRLSRDKDTRTLRFDWYLSRDGTECELREKYVDTEGMVEHRKNIADAVQVIFRDFAYDHQARVFGDPSPEFVNMVNAGPMKETVKWYSFLQGLVVPSGSPRSETFSPELGAKLEMGAHMTVRPQQLEGFKKQAAELLSLTQQKDTRTLRYDWFLNRDGTDCEVREAYVDEQGLIEHNANVMQARGTFFELFADNHFMSVYGEASPKLLQLVEATHMNRNLEWFSFIGGLNGRT